MPKLEEMIHVLAVPGKSSNTAMVQTFEALQNVIGWVLSRPLRRTIVVANSAATKTRLGSVPCDESHGYRQVSLRDLQQIEMRP